jgi:hypothetical protein
VPPPWGGFVVVVAMAAMKTVVATTACKARLSGMLSSYNGYSRSRSVIGDEDGRF